MRESKFFDCFGFTDCNFINAAKKDQGFLLVHGKFIPLLQRWNDLNIDKRHY